MSSNVSRTFNLNHLTFAKNTNNELMNAYIKKLYQRIPGSTVGSINTQAVAAQDRYAHQRDAQLLSPNVVRKSARKRLKPERTATMTLVNEAKSLAMPSPMAKFYNSRRYHSSASTSSTAIVSKRYNTKPRRRTPAPRPNKLYEYKSNNLEHYRPAEPSKPSNNFQNEELMNIDITLKRLISLGPQRSAMSHPIRRPYTIDPLTGWNHPPDIRTFSFQPSVPKKPYGSANAAPSTHRPGNSFMGRPQQRSLWAAAGKGFGPLKKPVPNADFAIKHGAQQVKSLKKASNSERLLNDNSEMINQQRHKQLFRQKTKMLQELLEMSEQQRKLKETEEEVTPRRRQHGTLAKQVNSNFSLKSQKLRSKLQQAQPRENLRQSIESISTLNVRKPSAAADPIKLVKKTSQLSVQDLLMGTGRTQQLHQLHDRLKTQYRRNYVLQQQEITTEKPPPMPEEPQGKHLTAKQIGTSTLPNLDMRQSKSMFNLPTSKVTATASAINFNKRKYVPPPQRPRQIQIQIPPQNLIQTNAHARAQSQARTHAQARIQAQARTTTPPPTQIPTPTRTRIPTPTRTQMQTQSHVRTPLQVQSRQMSKQQLQMEPEPETQTGAEPEPQEDASAAMGERVKSEAHLSGSRVLNKDDSYLAAIQAAYKKISENSLGNLMKRYSKNFKASTAQNRRY